MHAMFSAGTAGRGTASRSTSDCSSSRSTLHPVPASRRPNSAGRSVSIQPQPASAMAVRIRSSGQSGSMGT